MADKYRYTGGRHTSESGDVVQQGEVYEPSQADLRNKQDLWEPVTEGASVAGADIGLRSLEWGSRAALDSALDAGLEVADFEGIGPSGATGYVMADVNAAREA